MHTENQNLFCSVLISLRVTGWLPSILTMTLILTYTAQSGSQSNQLIHVSQLTMTEHDYYVTCMFSLV